MAAGNDDGGTTSKESLHASSELEPKGAMGRLEPKAKKKAVSAG
jgi:hypothetical protein